MRKIFLDTAYLKALIDSGDNLYELSQMMAPKLGKFQGITSEMVLTELLNAFCSRGEYLRRSVIRLTHDLRSDRSIIIIPQTSEQFEQAFEFYQRRLDKGYSLTDCSSMQIMREQGINEILTFDKHFQQEGFRALLRE